MTVLKSVLSGPTRVSRRAQRTRCVAIFAQQQLQDVRRFPSALSFRRLPWYAPQPDIERRRSAPLRERVEVAVCT